MLESFYYDFCDRTKQVHIIMASVWEIVRHLGLKPFQILRAMIEKSTIYIFAMKFYFVKGHCTVEVAMNYQTI